MDMAVMYLLIKRPLRMNEEGALQTYAISPGSVSMWSYSINTAPITEGVNAGEDVALRTSTHISVQRAE